MKRFYFSICILGVLALCSGVLSSASASESFLQKPHLYTKGVEGLFSDSHGGYGYVSAISEAAAEQVFQFSCGKDVATPATNGDLFWKSIMPGNPEYQEFVRLRRQLFEYLVLRFKALNTKKSTASLVKPPCMEEAESMTLALSALPSHSPSDEEISKAPDNQKLHLMKYRSTLKQLTPVSLIYAHLFDLDLSIQQQNDCAMPSARCTEIQYFQQRLKSDFTPLFSVSEDVRKKFGDDLMNFIGNVNADTGALAGVSANTSQLVNWEQTLDRFVRQSSSRQARKSLKDQFHEVMVGSRQIWKQYRDEVDVGLADFCSYSISDILEKYPNVVRQSLIEVDEKSRPAYQAMLCKSLSLEKIRIKPNCTGVTELKSPDGISTVSVNQKLYSYPFSSVNRFTIQGHGFSGGIASQILTLPVPVVFDADITSEERQRTLKLWNQVVSDWYNCQAGTLGKSELEYVGSFTTPAQASAPENLTRTSCAKSPVVVDGRVTSYQVNYFIPAEPLPKGAFSVKVHRCFRSEIGATNCESVRTYALNKLIQSRCKIGDLDCQAMYQADVPTAGDPANNRANSGNYIMHQRLGTAIHEAGHLLGLADEYTDYMLPLNFLGEPDSVMRSSSIEKPRLYPRHFQKILEPMRCVL